MIAMCCSVSLSLSRWRGDQSAAQTCQELIHQSVELVRPLPVDGVARARHGLQARAGDEGGESLDGAAGDDGILFSPDAKQRRSERGHGLRRRRAEGVEARAQGELV